MIELNSVGKVKYIKIDDVYLEDKKDDDSIDVNKKSDEDQPLTSVEIYQVN